MSYKITRLKLVNFKGIKKGLGKTELELDFTLTNKRLVLFLGGNGSGKSTIVSTLHPFSGIFDEHRDSFILDDAEGRKEIDILQDDGTTYSIVHCYGSKTSSFITRTLPDGTTVELNPAGTVRSFVATVESELGVNEDFFKLVKLGSKSTNFIDLRPSARKEFMGNFTPNIESYLQAFKNVSARVTLTQREIRYITNESDKLPQVSNVKKNITILEKTIKDLVAKNNKISRKLEAIESMKKENSETLEEIASLEEQRKTITSRIKIEKDEIDRISKLFKRELVEDDTTPSSFKEVIVEIEQRKEANRVLLEDNRVTVAQKTQENDSLKNENKRALSSIDELTQGEGSKNVDELRAFIASQIKERDTLDILYDLDELTPDDVQQEQDDINDLLKFVDTAYTSITTERPSLIEELMENNKKCNSVSKLLDIVDSEQTKSEKKLEELSKEITKLSRKILEDQANLKAAESAQRLSEFCALQNSECCLYTQITCANDDVKLGESVDSKKLKDLNGDKDDIENYLESLDEVVTYLNRIIKASSRNSEVVSDIEEYLDITILSDVGVNTVSDIFILNCHRELETVEKGLKTMINNLRKVRKYFNIQATIDRSSVELSKYSNNEGTIKVLNDTIDLNKKSIKVLEEELTVLIEEGSVLERRNSVLDVAITNHYKVLDSLVIIREQEKELTSVDKALNSLNRLIKDFLSASEEKESLEEEHEDLENTIEMHSGELDEFKLDLLNIRKFNERKEELEATRTKLILVKDALDIKTGIPLILVGDYLEAIRTGTNRLLHIAFKGKFYIDFEISDKSFDIPVYSDGRKSANDIKECSQGEQALVKTSLSLGIIAEAIRNSIKQYNIVYLDEIDSELDHFNRMVFLDILNNQLDTLHSEQCFVITHNDCFFNNEAGLVVLQGANVDLASEEFMSNKDIIYNYED